MRTAIYPAVVPRTNVWYVAKVRTHGSQSRPFAWWDGRAFHALPVDINRAKLYDKHGNAVRACARVEATLQTIDAVTQERERIIALLASTEFTSLDHMPHEAATLIRATAEVQS